MNMKPSPFTRIEWLIIAAIGVILILLLAGCGSTTTRESSTVEREDLVAGPMVVDTPIGQFVMHPTKVTRFRTEDTRENAEKSYQFPEVREIGGAVLGGLTGPLAGGGFVGLISAGLMLLTKRKNDAEKAELERQRTANARQRDELADGVESAKEYMDTDTWAKVRKTLADNQSDDTVAAVKARVG